MQQDARYCRSYMSVVASNSKLNQLIRKADSTLGTTLEPLEPVVEKRLLHKLLCTNT